MKKVTENTKVTLTLKQLKRLVKESSYDDDKVEREQIELLDQMVDCGIFEDEYEASDWRNGLEIALRNSMKENLPYKMRSMSANDLSSLAYVMINIFARELIAAKGKMKKIKESWSEYEDDNDRAYEYKSYVPHVPGAGIDGGWFFRDENDAYAFSRRLRRNTNVRKRDIDGEIYWWVFYW